MTTAALTYGQHPIRVKPDYHPIARHPVLCRQDCLRLDAARVWRQLLTRGIAVAGFSAKKLSNWRQDGGALGDIGAYMLARPDQAGRLSTEVDSYAATAREMRSLTLVAALREAREADIADELPQHDVAVNPSPDRLRELRARYAESVAKLRAAIAAIDAALAQQ